MTRRQNTDECGSAATVVVTLLSFFIIGGGLALWFFFSFLPALQNERARAELEEIRKETTREQDIETPTAGPMQVCSFTENNTEIHLYLHGPRIRIGELPNGGTEGAIVYIHDGQILAVFDTNTESPAWRRGSEETAKAITDRASIYRNSPDIECTETPFDSLIFRRQDDPVAQELQ